MTAKRPTAVPRGPSVEQQIADIGARVYELERSGAGDPQNFRDLGDAHGNVMLHGQSWSYNFHTGFWQPRMAEAVRFCMPGLAADGWLAGESGAELPLLGYVGEVYAVGATLAQADATTATVVQAMLNHVSMVTLTFPAGSTTPQVVPLSVPTTGADDDVLTANLVSFGAGAAQLVMKVRFF